MWSCRRRCCGAPTRSSTSAGLARKAAAACTPAAAVSGSSAQRDQRPRRVCTCDPMPITARSAAWRSRSPLPACWPRACWSPTILCRRPPGGRRGRRTHLRSPARHRPGLDLRAGRRQLDEDSRRLARRRRRQDRDHAVPAAADEGRRRRRAALHATSARWPSRSRRATRSAQAYFDQGLRLVVRASTTPRRSAPSRRRRSSIRPARCASGARRWSSAPTSTCR